MFPFRIIEHFDIIEHVLACELPRFVGLAPDPLGFEQMEEAFSDRSSCFKGNRVLPM